MRRALVESCRRFGLIVAGYSGRDSSIMDALEEALTKEGAFPAGLFWLHREDGQLNLAWQSKPPWGDGNGSREHAAGGACSHQMLLEDVHLLSVPRKKMSLQML